MRKRKKNQLKNKSSKKYDKEMRLSCVQQANMSKASDDQALIPLAADIYDFIMTGKVKFSPVKEAKDLSDDASISKS